MPKNSPTIFIVEDNSAVCESLRWLFESVGLSAKIYNNGLSYLEAYDPTHYGCVLIDIRLPGMSGLELQQKLVELNNPLPVFIITGHGDVSLAVRAMKAGAKDFILKPFNNEILLEQIQKALAENQQHYQMQQKFVAGIKQLTRREREIMELIVAGKLNKQIASQLNLSTSTVEQHRAHIMEKVQTKSLAELVKLHLLYLFNTAR